jgi:hypothetical protein
MDLKPTPASAWRKTELLTLPSGNVARVKDPDVISMISEDGEVPPIFLALAKGGKNAEKELGLAEIADMMPLLNRVATAALLEPRIAEQPQGEGEIALSDLTTVDKFGIFHWTMEAFSKLKNFRSQPTLTLATLPDGTSDLPKSSRPDGVATGNMG